MLFKFNLNRILNIYKTITQKNTGFYKRKKTEIIHINSILFSIKTITYKSIFY